MRTMLSKVWCDDICGHGVNTDRSVTKEKWRECKFILIYIVMSKWWAGCELWTSYDSMVEVGVLIIIILIIM